MDYQTTTRPLVGQARVELDKLAAFLDKLDSKGWQKQSACEGWSVRQVVDHLAVGSTFVRELLEMKSAGEPVRPFDQARREALIEEFKALTNAGAAKRMEEETRAGLEGFDKAGPDMLAGPVPFFGREVPLAFLAGLRLSELALHGWDIYAASSGGKHARLDPLSVDLLFPGLIPMLPRFIQTAQTEDLNEVYAFKLGNASAEVLTVKLAGGSPPQIFTGEGSAPLPTLTIDIDRESFYRLAWGRLDLPAALKEGTVSYSGSPGEDVEKLRVLRLEKIFRGI